MKSVILVGDSIRMGYQEKVRELLSGRADVWGPEQNGGTSENVLAHLDEWVLSRNADVIHINCGLHDIKKEFGEEAAAVPLDTYRENVRAILSRLKEESDAIVVWALTTPVNYRRHHENKQFDRFEEDVDAYNAAASEVCGELGVPTNDLNAAVVEAGRDDILQKDGVHYTDAGCDYLGEKVAAYVGAVLENQ
jgi:lysophospholipase L1-like esterase